MRIKKSGIYRQMENSNIQHYRAMTGEEIARFIREIFNEEKKKQRTMPNLKSNHREQLIYKKYIDLGYECLTKGYPDFCFYNGDRVIFIEVKKKEQRYTVKKGLSRHQQKMIDIFKGLGLDVRVEYVE